MSDLTFILLQAEYALSRLNADEAIPEWAFQSSFYSISKTTDELSVVCESKFVPGHVKSNKGWRILKIDAIMDLSLTGITAEFSTVLAEAGINLCVVATYDTDYILIQQEKLQAAMEAFKKAGFSVQQ